MTGRWAQQELKLRLVLTNNKITLNRFSFSFLLLPKVELSEISIPHTGAATATTAIVIVGFTGFAHD